MDHQVLEDYLTNYVPNLRGPRRRVWNRDKGLCAVCFKFTYSWTIDHIKPKRDKGTYHLQNLQTLCWVCHHLKNVGYNPTGDGGYMRVESKFINKLTNRLAQRRNQEKKLHKPKILLTDGN